MRPGHPRAGSAHAFGATTSGRRSYVFFEWVGNVVLSDCDGGKCTCDPPACGGVGALCAAALGGGCEYEYGWAQVCSCDGVVCGGDERAVTARFKHGRRDMV